MNEIILTGHVLSKKNNYNNKIISLYLNTDDGCSIPIYFRNIRTDIIDSIINKNIAISGHVEIDEQIKIFVDVLKMNTI